MAGHQQQAGQEPQSESVATDLQELIDWRESVAAGVGAWIVGIVLTYLVLLGFDVAEQHEGFSTFELSNWVFLESIGGVIEADMYGLFTISLYAALDSDIFGAGVAIHAFIPLIVLTIAGYLLAGRHLDRGDATNTFEGIVAGASLTVGFAAVFVISMVIFEDSAVSVDMGSVLLMSVLYSLVFASVGAAIKTGSSVLTIRGLLGGIGAFFVGLGGWYVIEDPLEGMPADSFSDLEGTLTHFTFFAEFIGTNGVLDGDLLPEWYVMAGLLLVGAAITYKYKTLDPVAGSGQGARLAVGYVIPVAIFYIGFVGAYIREINRMAEGRWTIEQVDMANTLIATGPVSIILAGIVYPAVFLALGGAIGVKIYENQNDTAE